MRSNGYYNAMIKVTKGSKGTGNRTSEGTNQEPTKIPRKDEQGPNWAELGRTEGTVLH